MKYLKDCEILENTIHHVFLRQVLQLVNEVDHVLAHRRTADAINEPAILEPGILSLQLLHHLFSERAYFRRTRYRHVLVALVPRIWNRTVDGVCQAEGWDSEKNNSLAGYAVKRAGFILDVRIEIRPKFDKEEGSLWSLVVELFEPILFLRKLVVYLPYIYRLEQRIRICCRTSYVDE